MKTYPKAKVTVKVDRRKPRGTTARGHAHTTETPSSAFYTRYPYYTFQVREYDGRVYWRQFSDPEQIPHALRHDRGDPETNGEGTVNVALSVCGYARNMPLMSDLLVKEIAEFLIWCDDELGIPADFPGAMGSGGSECYGYDSPCRMSWPDWKTFTGWCGHQNVPGNTHWDPNLPTDRIEAAVAAIRAGTDVPTEPDLKDGEIMLELELPLLRTYAGYSSKGKAHQREAVRTLQGLLLKEDLPDENTTDPRTYADGYFGPGTEASVRAYQDREGLAVDGVVGTATWTALIEG